MLVYRHTSKHIVNLLFITNKVSSSYNKEILPGVLAYSILFQEIVIITISFYKIMPVINRLPNFCGLITIALLPCDTLCVMKPSREAD